MAVIVAVVSVGVGAVDATFAYSSNSYNSNQRRTANTTKYWYTSPYSQTNSLRARIHIYIDAFVHIDKRLQRKQQQQKRRKKKKKRNQLTKKIAVESSRYREKIQTIEVQENTHTQQNQKEKNEERSEKKNETTL